MIRQPTLMFSKNVLIPDWLCGGLIHLNVGEELQRAYQYKTIWKNWTQQCRTQQFMTQHYRTQHVRTPQYRTQKYRICKFWTQQCRTQQGRIKYCSTQQWRTQLLQCKGKKRKVLPVQDKTAMDKTVQEKNSKGLTSARHTSERHNYCCIQEFVEVKKVILKKIYLI